MISILAATCTSDLDCSLNGVCTASSCVCDKPWMGPHCEQLRYAITPVSAKDLYPFNNTGSKVQPTTSLNTWNGPIVGPVDGLYHYFNPLYNKGSLIRTGGSLMHGVSTMIEGPYDWFNTKKHPQVKGGSNPAAVTYVDPADNKTKYTLWQGNVLQSETPDGPWVEVMKSYPGGNPAPVFHNNAWYFTSQRTKEVSTTPKLCMDATCVWTTFATIDHSNVTSGTTPEDPFMWIDKRENWHIINHAYNTEQYEDCGSSTLSTHFFSPDGKSWRSLPGTGMGAVQPYSHTVNYVDGTSHTYTTLERPNLHFNASGQLTHINLAADMITGDAGCAAYTSCPARGKNGCACTNCKYADHAGSIIIKLAV